jgi:hypothetical protein
MSLKDKIKILFGYKYKTFVFIGNVFGEFSVHCSLTVPIETSYIPDPQNYFPDSVTIWNRTPKAIRYDKTLTKEIMYWLTNTFDRIAYEREGLIRDGKGLYLQPYLV